MLGSSSENMDRLTYMIKNRIVFVQTKTEVRLL